MLDAWSIYPLDEELGTEDVKRFETIVVAERLYLVCEAQRTRYPQRLFHDLRMRVVYEWLPDSGYEFADAPELSVYHWFHDHEKDWVNQSRYIELWIPIVKSNAQSFSDGI